MSVWIRTVASFFTLFNICCWQREVLLLSCCKLTFSFQRSTKLNLLCSIGSSWLALAERNLLKLVKGPIVDWVEQMYIESLKQQKLKFAR